MGFDSKHGDHWDRQKTPGANEFPPGLIDPANTILNNETIDKEEKFLQLASLAVNYRICGGIPLKKEQTDLLPAPGEELLYCSTVATQLLKEILTEESDPLLKFWLKHCNDKSRIVHPEIISTLLSAGVQNKKLQPLITTCCGKRGQWLSRFNEDWNFSANQTSEEQWQTGSPEQRKTVLKETRNTNPAQAREWLQQIWSQEDAGTKQTFLGIISININKEDIPFLESLQVEKSKKLRDEAINLLKQIPDSSIVKMYQGILQQSIFLKKEKALLGLSSKMVLQVQLPSVINEEIFKSGIEKLSGQKNISDETHILYQLISFTPPEFWETQLNLSPGEIVTLFSQTKEAKELLPAIGLAAGRFKNANWVPHIIKDESKLYLDLINILPADKRENYLQLHFNSAPEAIINVVIKQETEWSLDLVKKIFKHTARNPYQYNRTFYSQNIHLIPGKIAMELERSTPSEESLINTWSNLSEHILKLLHLKAQIIQSFN